MIAEHLSVEEAEVIREMFKLMDTDRNGRITYDELKAGLQKVGSQLGEPEMRMLMESVSLFFSFLDDLTSQACWKHGPSGF